MRENCGTVEAQIDESGTDTDPIARFDFVEQDITAEDMPSEDMRTIYQEFGARVAVRLMSLFGGVPVFVPKTGLLKYCNRKIMSEFTGNNARALAIKYRVSVRHVYNVTGRAL